MKSQKSPNRWSCLPTSFAMVLREKVSTLIEECGHDGSEIWWPGFTEPYCRRGFHIQEMIWIAYRRDVAIVGFEPEPISISCSGSGGKKNINAIDIWPIMRGQAGVLTGQTLQGAWHAVAWNGRRIYDPNGFIKSRDEFWVQCFWLAK